MKIPILLCVAALAILPLTHAHSHEHIDAGSSNSGADLAIYNVFDLATIRTPTYADYVDHSESTTSEASINALIDAGYSYIYELTYTALNAYSPNPLAEPYPNRYDLLGAKSGAFLQLQLVGFSGPGSFGFWENGNSSATPTWSVDASTDLMTSPVYISLTSPLYWDPAHPGNEALQDQLPGISSPFGHIHGRRFGVTADGEHTLTWQVVDTAETPVYGSPSAAFEQTFTAIPEPATGMLVALAAVIALSAGRRRMTERKPIG